MTSLKEMIYPTMKPWPRLLWFPSWNFLLRDSLFPMHQITLVQTALTFADYQYEQHEPRPSND